MKVGTLAWNHATGGRLRPQDRLALSAQAVRVQLRLLGEQGRRRLGLRGPALAALDLDALQLPDTAAVRSARELCEEASEPFLAAHCHRTYLWGCILGAHDGLRWDHELLGVAALLHDLGLTERYADPSPHRGCFTRLAEAPTRELGAAVGWSEARCDTVAEAIALHLNVEVGREHGAEARLLQAGAACDVVGIRTAQIDPVTHAAVLARHPRLDLKRQVPPTIRARADAPGTRTRFILTVGQFERRVKAAPFAE